MRSVRSSLSAAELLVVRERFPAASKACGHHIEASTVILDLGGVSWYTFWSMRSVLSRLINRASAALVPR